jgi:hypothetical protein
MCSVFAKRTSSKSERVKEMRNIHRKDGRKVDYKAKRKEQKERRLMTRQKRTERNRQ